MKPVASTLIQELVFPSPSGMTFLVLT